MLLIWYADRLFVALAVINLYSASVANRHTMTIINNMDKNNLDVTRTRRRAQYF